MIPLPRVLREEPAYRLLFSSQLLSVIGDRVTTVALPFAVLATGGGIGQVAVVSTAQFLPFALLALPAGVWADRLDRRRIMMASDAVRLATQLVAAILLLSGTASVWQLAALAAVFGAADAFFAPAFSGLLPTTVAPLHVQQANALRGLSFSVSAVVGPTLAGALIAFAGGPGAALLFDALSFAASFALLIRLRPREVDELLAEETSGQEGFLTSLREGWSAVRSRPWLVWFLAGLGTYHVVVLPAIFVIGPVLMQQDYDGATSWAVLVACFGVGSMLGDVVLLRWRPRHALRVGALALVGASLQAAMLASRLPVLGLAPLVLAGGTCVTLVFTLWETSLGEHVPERTLSRVSSYDYLVSVGLIPVGNAAVGAVAGVVDLHTLLWGMSAVGVTVALGVGAVPAVRSLPRGAM